MHLTIPNLMAVALLCVVLETEMFTLNFFSAGQDISTTELYNKDNQHTNIRTKLDQLKKACDHKELHAFVR